MTSGGGLAPHPRCDVVAAVQQGNALRAAGRLQEAIAYYRKAIALHAECSPCHFNLGIALREAGDPRGAVVAFRHAARSDARNFDAVQNVVATIATAVEAGAPPLFPRAEAPGAPGRAPVSIVVCSVEPDRLARMQASYRAALGAREHEFIVIRDAKSLSEGYGRGLRAARHPIVVFSHDDVEILSPGAFEAFDAALERHDIAGLVGSTRVSGPAALWTGHPHIHGWVAYPAQGAAFTATLFSLETGIIGRAESLDGLLFAARREAALSVGFDEKTFDGFHFYDLDFTYRAHLAGLRIAVTTQITAVHASAGSFDDAWRLYASRFLEKFPHLTEARGAHFAFSALLGSRERLLRFYDELRGLAALA